MTREQLKRLVAPRNELIRRMAEALRRICDEFREECGCDDCPLLQSVNVCDRKTLSEEAIALIGPSKDRKHGGG
jgi:hypothetical protein